MARSVVAVSLAKLTRPGRHICLPFRSTIVPRCSKARCHRHCGDCPHGYCVCHCRHRSPRPEAVKKRVDFHVALNAFGSCHASPDSCNDHVVGKCQKNPTVRKTGNSGISKEQLPERIRETAVLYDGPSKKASSLARSSSWRSDNPLILGFKTLRVLYCPISCRYHRSRVRALIRLEKGLEGTNFSSGAVRGLWAHDEEHSSERSDAWRTRHRWRIWISRRPEALHPRMKTAEIYEGVPGPLGNELLSEPFELAICARTPADLCCDLYGLLRSFIRSTTVDHAKATVQVPKALELIVA